jgi:hypothetical protein
MKINRVAKNFISTLHKNLLKFLFFSSYVIIKRIDKKGIKNFITSFNIMINKKRLNEVLKII